MRTTRWLAVATICGSLVTALAEEPAVEEPAAGKQAGDGHGFEWSKRDEKRLGGLERKADHDELYDMWSIEGADWTVEAGTSARYAAEASLFMERFQAVFDKLVSRDRRVRGLRPTVVIFADETRFRELHNDRDRHWFGYDWDDDSAWIEFHLYSFAGEGETEFTDYPLHKLTSGAGRACLQQALGQRKAPAWLKYGVRAYFRSWRLQDSIPLNLKARYARSKYLPALKEAATKGLPGLGPLLGRASEDFSSRSENSEQNYALAESFVDMLIGSRQGAKLLAEVLTNLTSKSEDTPPLDDKQVQQLEPLWHAHIHRLIQ